MYQDLIRNELNEAAETLANFLKDDANIHAIQRAAVLLADSFKAGGKVLSCGNGGSHCDAMHFAEELTGRYRENRPGYPAIAISDVSHISCVGNDFGFNDIFSRYVEAVGREGDVLLGISTSGNSANVIKAIAAAREKGMKVITLTGKDGGKMAGTDGGTLSQPTNGFLTAHQREDGGETEGTAQREGDALLGRTLYFRRREYGTREVSTRGECHAVAHQHGGAAALCLRTTPL